MTSQHPIISVRGVTKTYWVGEVEVKALQDVSLDVERGDFVVITGRNGAGKSTLMHNIAVLDTPDCGEVIIDGRDVTKMTSKERRNLRLQQLGYVFQEHALIAELTALENVMLPAMVLKPTKDAKARASVLLSRVGLERCAGHLPSQLSGGEQQKTAIARALINEPTVVYADEPTASLDSVAARDVLDIFAKLNHEDGRTVVMVTHEQDDERYAKRVVRLSDGRIADDHRVA